MSALSREFGVSLSAMTRIADRLERTRLVKRVAEGNDRRIRRLQLTPRGEKIMRERNKARVRSVSAVLAQLPPKARKGVRKALETLMDACTAMKEQRVSEMCRIGWSWGVLLLGVAIARLRASAAGPPPAETAGGRGQPAGGEGSHRLRGLHRARPRPWRPSQVRARVSGYLDKVLFTRRKRRSRRATRCSTSIRAPTRPIWTKRRPPWRRPKRT